MANDRAQEHNVASRSCRDIEICQRRGARVVRVNMDNLCAALFRLYYIGIGNRVGLGHIAAHNQKSIAIHWVVGKCRGAATSTWGTPSGYGRAVSYTGLVLDSNNS